MSVRRGDLWMRITHVPTGTTVEGTGDFLRSSWKLRRWLLASLQSKLYAMNHGMGPSEEIVRTYSIPDDTTPYPYDLAAYGDAPFPDGLAAYGDAPYPHGQAAYGDASYPNGRAAYGDAPYPNDLAAYGDTPFPRFPDPE